MSEDPVRAQLEMVFPGLNGSPYSIVSPKDSRYNCHAFAVGNREHWHDDSNTWPNGVPRDPSLEGYGRRFLALGFEETELGYDPGYELVALFCDSQGDATHSALQLDATRWASKLGKSHDITHQLADLEGKVYGKVVAFFRRRKSSR